jgi:hypothetical protein
MAASLDAFSTKLSTRDFVSSDMVDFGGVGDVAGIGSGVRAGAATDAACGALRRPK